VVAKLRVHAQHGFAMTMGLVGIAKPPAALLNAGCSYVGW